MKDEEDGAKDLLMTAPQVPDQLSTDCVPGSRVRERGISDQRAGVDVNEDARVVVQGEVSEIDSNIACNNICDGRHIDVVVLVELSEMSWKDSRG